jgi:hypothetical protein
MIRAVLVLLLVTGLAGIAASGQPTGRANAQEATPGPAAHPLVGAWIVEDLHPPNGGPPLTTGTVSLFADGNLLLGGPVGTGIAQGSWVATSDRAATLTVVNVGADQSGASDGTLQRTRGSIELNPAHETWVGGFTFEVIDADGEVMFTFHSAMRGTRVAIAPPDPVAMTLIPGTPPAATPEP